jgi:hypothetical protein
MPHPCMIIQLTMQLLRAAVAPGVSVRSVACAAAAAALGQQLAAGDGGASPAEELVGLVVRVVRVLCQKTLAQVDSLAANPKV